MTPRMRWECGVGLVVVLATLAVDALAELPHLVRYDGYQVLRVQVSDAAAAEALYALDLDVWATDPLRGTMDVMVDPFERPLVDSLGLSYDVWVADVQRLVDNEQRSTGDRSVWFNSYHNYADIVTYMNDLVAAHPNLASMVNVGTSLEGRTIWGLRIAGPNQGPFTPAVVYFAAVHAREWIATTVPTYVATELLDNYGTNPQVTALVDDVEWILIPVANPDGFEFSWNTERLWRKNRRDNGDGTFGVDINRNWGYEWGNPVGASPRPSSGIYHGPAPFSEPETRALRDLLLANPQVRTMNDIHSYSQLILWPWGYTPLVTPDEPRFQVVGQAQQAAIQAVHGKTYEIGPINTAIYAVSGDSLDWAYAIRNIFGFSYELRDTGQNGFVLPANQIVPNNEEIYPAILIQSSADEVLNTHISVVNERPYYLISGQPHEFELAMTTTEEHLDANTAMLHYRYDATGTFSTVPLTYHGGASFTGTLPATHCNSTPEYYFSIDGTNGTTYQPAGAPSETYSAFMLSGLTIYDEPLDLDPGWTAEGDWAFGQPTGEGGVHGDPDPEMGHTGTNVYGYNLEGNYARNLPETHLTSTPIDCSFQWGLHVSFWRWLGVEETPYDHASFSVSNDGVTWTTVWANTLEIADDEWVQVDFDISDVADNQPTVYLRWTMGATDSGVEYCGWNIDDVQIYATGCESIPGDFDGDNAIDLDDMLALFGCLQGPDAGIGAGCTILDITLDADVDVADLADLQTQYVGL
jgi:carboxypeptidase A4